MTFDLWTLDGLDQVERVTGQSAVQVQERDLGGGGWVLDIPVHHAGGPAEALLSATWPGLEIFDSATNWRWGGYLTAATMIMADGVETARFVGKDFQAELAARLEWPDSGDPGNWWQNTEAGTVPRTTDAQTMVYFNVGPGALAYRRLQGLTGGGLVFGTDLAAGSPQARRIKGLPLIEVLRSLFWGTEWTARLRLVRNAASGAPSLLFETPARATATTVLDAKRGAFGSVEHTTAAFPATHFIAMGGEIDPGPDRLVRTGPGIIGADWRFRHSEVFLNRPAAEDASILNDEILSAYTEQALVSVKVDQAQVEGYGRDLDLGQLVPVRFGTSFGSTSTTLPVVASTLTFDPNKGWTRTVDLGTERLSNEGVVMSSLAAIARRARQLEAEL